MRFSGILFIILFQSLFSPAKAQHSPNLVPDGGFESNKDCPREFGSVTKGVLQHWRASPPDCTPDYFNYCSVDFGVPRNKCGYLEAHSGKGYIGLILRIGQPYEQTIDEILYREHIQARLLAPLEKNCRYIIEMYVSLSEYSNYTAGSWGVLLTDHPIAIDYKKGYEPQVIVNTIDVTKKWVRVVDTILAKGGERYITIGEFSSFMKRDVQKFVFHEKHKDRFSYNRAYYFIDDVSLTYLDQLLTPEDTTPAPPPQRALTARKKMITGWEKDWELEETSFGFLEIGKPIILKNVLFEFGKATLLEESSTELEQLVGLLKKFPEMKIIVIGHTDDVGLKEANLKLSEDRAKSIYEYLIRAGIEAYRLNYVGYGDSSPLLDNNSEQERKYNRRVEFIIVDE